MRQWRIRNAMWAGAWLPILALLIQCDGGGPTSVTLNVGGEWIEISTLVADNCDLGLPPTATSNVTIIPSGNQITFVFHSDGFDDAVLNGTFDSRTGQFSLTFAEQGGGISVTALQSGRFTSSSRYTSTSEIVVTQGGASCTVRTSEAGERRS
jgi:hypothetical protein